MDAKQKNLIKKNRTKKFKIERVNNLTMYFFIFLQSMQINDGRHSLSDDATFYI